MKRRMGVETETVRVEVRVEVETARAEAETATGETLKLESVELAFGRPARGSVAA